MVPPLDFLTCDRCGAPKVEVTCQECFELSTDVQSAVALYPFFGWVAQGIRRLKYQNEWTRAAQFGPALAAAAAGIGAIDAIVPVPLHRSRERQRGYNQSACLARAITELGGIPTEQMLIRTRKTPSQVDLGRQQRRTNVADAFEVSLGSALLQGRSVLLIDDVRTTGSTVNACAEVLVRGGSRKVSVLTVALDVRPALIQDWLRARQPLYP